MEVKAQSLSDYDHLDIRSEESPEVFAENYKEYLEQYARLVTESYLQFCLAKAYVRLERYSEAETILLNLSEKAVFQHNYELLAKCNVVLSKCYEQPESSYKVKPCLDLAEEYARTAENVELLADVLSHIGLFYRTRNNHKQALAYQLKAVNLISKSIPSLTVANISIRIGNLYYSIQQFDKALKFLTQALNVCKTAGIEPINIHVINSMTAVYIETKQFSTAEELLLKGIELCKEYQNPKMMLKLVYNLGIILNQLGKYSEAIKRYHECIDLAHITGLNNPQFLLDIYNGYASCYWQLGQPEQSMKYLEGAEKIAAQSENQDLFWQVCLNKSNVLIATGEYDEAEQKLIEAGKYYGKLKKYSEYLISQHNLAGLYKKKQDFVRSINIHENIEKAYEKYVIQIMSEKVEAHTKQIAELMDQNDQISHNFAILSHSTPGRQVNEFVGQSEAHQKVLNSTSLAAQHPKSNVIILGESGTGKEIIANLIHHLSVRRDFPFIPVNASAISAGLVESELFGHVKGAFTGALSDTKGFFMQADKGTIFLDEITEMPIEFQAKLLRVLESRKVTPVGSSKEVIFDSRIISSSNRDIYEQVQRNEFRLDLLHRLNTIEIHIPPLRSRKEDIEMLVHYFIEKYALETKRTKPTIDSSFLEKLKQYSFPGNVRELKNIIERLFILTNSLEWDERVLCYVNPIFSDKDEFIAQAINNDASETERLIKALIKTDGKQKDAARLLNMSESTFCRRIAKYKLENYTRKGK